MNSFDDSPNCSGDHRSIGDYPRSKALVCFQVLKRWSFKVQKTISDAGVLHSRFRNIKMFCNRLYGPSRYVRSLWADAALTVRAKISVSDLNHFFSRQTKRVISFAINKMADDNVPDTVSVSQAFDRPAVLGQEFGSTVSFRPKIEAKNFTNFIIGNFLSGTDMPVLRQNVPQSILGIATKSSQIEMLRAYARPYVAMVTDQFFFVRPPLQPEGDYNPVRCKVLETIMTAFLVRPRDCHQPVSAYAFLALPKPARIARTFGYRRDIKAPSKHVKRHPRRLRGPIWLAEHTKWSLHKRAYTGGQDSGQA